MRVAEVISQIQQLPNTYVGCGFRQGRRAVLQHFLHMLGPTNPAVVERQIARARRRLARLTKLVAPHSLPDDYRFFLEHYAKLTFGPSRDSLYFSIFGVGPTITGGDGDVVEYQADANPAGINHVYIALWSARVGANGQTNDPLGIVSQKSTVVSDEKPIPINWVRFYLDLAGTIQEYSVVVPEDLSQALHKPGWRKIAPSFTDWLESVAVTGGTFGYTLIPDEDIVDF
jgi:hypothetical protein